MPNINERAGKMLTTLMNLKRSKFLDQNTAYMIDSAYQEAVPSAGHAAIVVKEIPLLHKYLKHLLVGQTLDEGALNSVVMRLRKLPWSAKSGSVAGALAAARATAKAAQAAQKKGAPTATETHDEEQDETTANGEQKEQDVDPTDAGTQAALGADGLLHVLTKYILSTCRGGRLDTIRVICRMLLRLRRSVFVESLLMLLFDAC